MRAGRWRARDYPVLLGGGADGETLAAGRPLCASFNNVVLWILGSVHSI